MARNDGTKLTGAASIIREEDLEDMTALENELADRVDKARQDGRAYMMAQYVRILAMIKSENTRIRARFDRESLAAMRKEQKELKIQEREEREKESA
jgi:hypothetical protein